MPQKIKVKMKAGEMTGKMYKASELRKIQDEQAKEHSKVTRGMNLTESREERMAAEEGRAVNKPTESKRIVTVYKGKSVVPSASRKLAMSYSSKLAKKKK